MNHPVTDQLQATGVPVNVLEPGFYGTDALGNEVFEGDPIYVVNDEFFLKEALIYESTQLLELLGAEEKRA
ncbi:hypothetical protein MUN89_15845 [Halobacillus salinarum]|uniref:Uncharacterized protein n=1 Tax=Halobacillus salinarum TaxID=2932257 RepID=A0ABY4EGW6_9BACI|nr:hypothetical protein [Halobacillus salinarum]UOQ43381.1 hypothetical protein MUN89_15845 [Halobacillus salinarum]